MTSRRALLLAALASLPALAACGSTGSAAPEDDGRPLVVASDLDNPPFAYIDAYGVPAGRDVEMMQGIAAALDVPLEWRRMEFEDLIPAVSAGRVDAACATLGVTPERRELVAFTRPYFETSLAVVVLAGPDAPRSLEDLAGARVAAAPGTTSARAVRERLRRATLVPAEGKTRDAAELLYAAEADAAVVDAPAAEAIVADSAGGLVRLPEDLAEERYAIAVPPHRVELLARLDRILARMAANGYLASLDREYELR